MSLPRRPYSLLLLAIVGALAGCAPIQVPRSVRENPMAEKEQRTRAVAEEFDRQRDEVEYQAALAAWQQNDIAVCEASLQRLLERNANHRDARLLMIEVHLSRQRPDIAFKEMEAALAAHPGDGMVLFAAGLLLDSTGQHEQAVAYYQRAAETDPNNDLFLTGLKAARASGQPIVVRPPVSNPLPAAASPDALARYQQPAFLPARGDVLPVSVELPASGASSPGEVSRPAATETIAFGSAQPIASTPAASLLQSGGQALQQGEAELALETFREAVSTDPHNPQIPIEAAAISIRLNRPDVAVALLEPVPEHFRQSAAYFRTLGLAYYRWGDFSKSQVALQQALSLDKSSALAYFLMGCTLARLGQDDLAAAHFEQAQVLDPRYSLRR
ncbi:MAG: tetratricopeptide repeat protein [Planctomycetota bacterium]